ncbi:MAG TPA: hypothetical protein VI653_03880 [Steroidobacteraceae bacterium]
MPIAVRAADLLARMTVQEKAGAMMDGTLPTSGVRRRPPNEQYDLEQVRTLILDSRITAFITSLSLPAAQLAEQNNELQAVAERGRLGIPLLISSDPRNHFDRTLDASVTPSGAKARESATRAKGVIRLACLPSCAASLLSLPR